MLIDSTHMNDQEVKNDLAKHPLHGLGLKTLLTELVDYYGWPILAEQMNINCFKTNPSINSSHKFLHKTTWAREKLEAFYLYKFKQFPLPTDEQHSLSPRNRMVELTPFEDSPAQISLGDPEFFDDPISGPVFPSKRAVQATRSKVKEPAPKVKESRRASSSKSSSEDPWAKWRE